MLSNQGARLRTVIDRLVGRPLVSRRRRVLRELERRSSWVEQARETPTMRQFVDAASVGRDAGGARRQPAS